MITGSRCDTRQHHSRSELDGKAEIRKVGVKRDMGTQVEADSGVKAGSQVILNPPVNLADGSKVQVRTEVAAASGG